MINFAYMQTALENNIISTTLSLGKQKGKPVFCSSANFFCEKRKKTDLLFMATEDKNDLKQKYTGAKKGPPYQLTILPSPEPGAKPQESHRDVQTGLSYHAFPTP